jgi:hypothetical protein
MEANWKKVTEWLFEPIGSRVGGAKKLKIFMWYNVDTISLTKVDLRFSLVNPGGGDYYDTFYLLFNPGKEASSTPNKDKMWRYGLKTKYTGNTSNASRLWPYEPTNSVPLTKDPLDKKFQLPPFWICNRGTYGEGKDASDIYYVMTHNTIGKDYYDPVEASEWEIEKSVSVAGPGTVPSLSVSYNKNNTFRLRTTLGKAGTKNNFKEAHLFYTLDGTNPASSSTRKEVSLKGYGAGSTFTTDLAIYKRMEKKEVKAYVVCKFDYNTQSATAENAEAFPYYQAPKPPSDIKLHYEKGRLTIKEPWKISWTAGSQANNDSPIKGYRFRIYKKSTSGVFKSIKLYDKDGNAIYDDLGAGEENNRYYYDTESTATSLTLYPERHDLKPNDTIKIGLFSYTKDGTGKQLFHSGQVFYKSADGTDARLIQNAGIMRVKVGTAWKEGQVYVKVGNDWKEAETVNVKTSAGWKESE